MHSEVHYAYVNFPGVTDNPPLIKSDTLVTGMGRVSVGVLQGSSAGVLNHQLTLSRISSKIRHLRFQERFHPIIFLKDCEWFN